MAQEFKEGSILCNDCQEYYPQTYFDMNIIKQPCIIHQKRKFIILKKPKISCNYCKNKKNINKE